MPSTATSTHHSFPASQGLQLVELAKRWGVEPAQLLEPFDLAASELESPDARLSLETVVALTERARVLTGEPGLGIYLGLAKHVAAYGYLGMATMSAATMREALEQAVELAPAVTTSVGLSLHVDGNSAALVVRELADVGPIRDVALFSLFVGFRQIARDLTGREDFGDIELAIPEPPYFHRFAHMLPHVRFGQPVSRLVFPAAGLDVPLTRPNRATLNLARKHCLEQLAALGFDASLPARARRALADADGFRGIDALADVLHLSVRTLKRRLAEHGVSYSHLLNEERELRALHLLRATDLTLDEIAARLGYGTTSSFSRAFTRWTGAAPGTYRREAREADVLAARRRHAPASER